MSSTITLAFLPSVLSLIGRAYYIDSPTDEGPSFKWEFDSAAQDAAILEVLQPAATFQHFEHSSLFGALTRPSASSQVHSVNNGGASSSSPRHSMRSWAASKQADPEGSGRWILSQVSNMNTPAEPERCVGNEAVVKTLVKLPLIHFACSHLVRISVQLVTGGFATVGFFGLNTCSRASKSERDWLLSQGFPARCRGVVSVALARVGDLDGRAREVWSNASVCTSAPAASSDRIVPGFLQCSIA